MFKLQWRYAFAAMLLFVVEVIIAVFVNDSFIRPYFGDFLVVVLMYCFLKSFWNAPVKTVAFSVLLFAYVIETLQHFELVKHLGLKNSTLANVVLGNSFAWSDLLAYTLGTVLILWLERKKLYTNAV